MGQDADKTSHWRHGAPAVFSPTPPRATGLQVHCYDCDCYLSLVTANTRILPKAMLDKPG